MVQFYYFEYEFTLNSSCVSSNESWPCVMASMSHATSYARGHFILQGCNKWETHMQRELLYHRKPKTCFHAIPYLHRRPLHTPLARALATLDATSYSMCVMNEWVAHVEETPIVNPKTNNKVLFKKWKLKVNGHDYHWTMKCTTPTTIYPHSTLFNYVDGFCGPWIWLAHCVDKWIL